MQIAVIGAGNIGRTLGGAWMRAGHQVSFGVRDPSATSAQQARSELGERARVVPIVEALGPARVVVLARRAARWTTSWPPTGRCCPARWSSTPRTAASGARGR